MSPRQDQPRTHPEVPIISVLEDFQVKSAVRNTQVLRDVTKTEYDECNRYPFRRLISFLLHPVRWRMTTERWFRCREEVVTPETQSASLLRVDSCSALSPGAQSRKGSTHATSARPRKHPRPASIPTGKTPTTARVPLSQESPHPSPDAAPPAAAARPPDPRPFIPCPNSA